MIELLAPQRLFLVLLFPLLILAHLLYHRRRRLVVSSLLIWQRTREQSRRALTIRRLLNINLLLQTFALVAAVLALTQPEVLREDRRDESPVVLLLDTSAGMAVREEGGIRIDILRRQVSDLLSRLNPRREVAVFVFSSRPELIGRFGSNDRELRTVLSELEPTEESSDLPSALALAREVYPAGEIHIFTDGAWDGTAVSIDREKDRLHILGNPQGNIGFVHASVTRAGSEMLFFSVIGSYGFPTTPVTVTLSADGSIINEEILTLTPDTTTELLFSVPANAGTIAEEGERYVLEVSAPKDNLDGNSPDGGGPEKDGLYGDNRAHLVPTQQRPMQIARIGEVNPFLESVLEVYPESQVDHFTRYSPAVNADILVLDGMASVAIPDGRVLALDSTIAGIHPAVPRYLPEGSSLEAATNHPIVAGIDFSTAYFERVFTVPPRDDLKPLLYHNDSYAGFTFETDRIKVVSLNFDSTRTNLVLQNAFPLLIHEALAWLSGDVSRPGTLRTGETLHIDTMPGDAVSVTNPAGETWSVTASATSTDYSNTKYAGFYSVVQNGRTRTVAVNIFSRDETNTLPRVQAHNVTDSGPGQKPLWRLLTILAIVLLATDTLLWSRKR